MAIDHKGQVWEAEMGPRGGDEINLIQPGKNYGWGDVTYGIEYSGKKINNATTQKTGTEQPVYYWDPSISMSGITFYTGNISEWKNNLFLGCLSGEKIIRLVIKDNKVMGEEWLLEDKEDRIRDVLNGNDGNLYAVSDSGKLYKISKK
jgi:glucose/arabinose dehydrogenase